MLSERARAAFDALDSHALVAPALSSACRLLAVSVHKTSINFVEKYKKEVYVL